MLIIIYIILFIVAVLWISMPIKKYRNKLEENMKNYEKFKNK